MMDVMTVQEVADFLKTTKRRVRELPIPQIRLGARTIRFEREDVLRYIKKRKLAA